MSLNAIHGKNAIVYMGTTSGGAAVVLAEQVDYAIAMTETFVDTTTLPGATGTVWGTQVKGPVGYKGTLAGKFDPTSIALWDAAILDGTVNFYLYPQASQLGRYYYGTAFITLPTVIAGGVKKEITNAVNMTGNGALNVTNN